MAQPSKGIAYFCGANSSCCDRLWRHLSGARGKHCQSVVIADGFNLVIGGRLRVFCCASGV